MGLSRTWLYVLFSSDSVCFSTVAVSQDGEVVQE